MSLEKLAQLRRQRELVQQHLDWLDGEIAGSSEEQPPQHGREAPLSPALDQVDPSESDLEAPVLKPDTLASSGEAKRGCLILFFIVISVLAATLVGIYFWKYSDRHLIFPEKAAEVSHSRSITF